MNHPATDSWDADTLRRRVAGAGVRHAAGSPSGCELAAYAAALDGLPAGGTAVVLGMTPELRTLAAARFARVVSIDRNPAAIALYADWLPAEARARERIVEAGWEAGLDGLAEAPTCVLADGALPNLAPAAQEALLRLLAERLAPGGRLVTRQPVIPPELETGTDLWPALCAAFRSGAIGADALGLGLRITGFLASHWRADDGRLDNAAVYAALDALRAGGRLTGAEHAAAGRFRFAGPNWILRRADWEGLAERCGLRTLGRRAGPEAWHPWYPVYTLAGA